MKNVSSILTVFGLFTLCCISYTNSYIIDGELGPQSRNTITYKYDRIDEVNKACGFLLSTASELRPDDRRVYTITNELSIVNGDWIEEKHESPIMPFRDEDRPSTRVRLSPYGNYGDQRNWSELTPLNLVSFWVVDIDRAHQNGKKSINIHGSMNFGITRGGSFLYQPNGQMTEFSIYPGHSQLTISFQGVYMETEENNGERIMCLLGSTMLPSREPNKSDPWAWLKEFGSNQPPLSQDDQILLVLRYPKTLSLKRRAVRGEMTSLQKKSNLKYFDEIHISSQLSYQTKYEFGSEALLSKACNPYPYQDNFTSSEVDTYKDANFCGILQRFTSQSFRIASNWRCNGTDEFCSRLGPFVSDKGINSTDGGFKDVKLLMQEVRCEMADFGKSTSFAKVATVFRVLSPSEDQYTSSQRSGIDGMTLSTEGFWKSSSGQLCMVGCVGVVDSETDTETDGCDSRVCLYLPRSFSIKQRSIAFGDISSINGSYFPLSFEKFVQSNELWDAFGASGYMGYNYSKIELAGALLEKKQEFQFGNIIKKSLMKYPKLEENYGLLSALSSLSEDLTLHIASVPDPLPKSHPQRIDTQMEIISLGSLFGRAWSYANESSPEKPYHEKSEYSEKQLLLNVSAQLALSGEKYTNFSTLFLEGIYDQRVGKMFLIGCRDVRASWKILFDSSDLESGLDCLIEVVVSYPPTTARWLVNPTAKISITSKRNEDEPLHFSTVNIQTLPIMYQRQREDILSRRGVEGILRILTLSVAISCILSQLFYIRNNVDSVPFTSLVMLFVQALGYSLPLVTGAEALFKKMANESYERRSYVYSNDLQKNQLSQVIDSVVKLLVLISFLLTLRLCQKVWKSRTRLLSRAPLEPLRVPSDKLVVIATLVIHAIGYVVVLIIHPQRTEKYFDTRGVLHTTHDWARELEEYVGLVQDFFLLPQIIGNVLWQIHCQPLRKMYYIGITVVRLLPHVYDYMRTPVFNPYFSEQFEFVNPNLDFYSKFGDVAIPMMAIFLAIGVYVQQRWSYEKLRQALGLRSRGYSRLPSKVQEAELVSNVDENGSSHGKERDEEFDL